MLLEDLSDEELIEYYKLFKKSSKRAEGVKIYKFDCKYAYNVVRLINEVEQIMVEGDLDLERNREQLKAIRRGEWSQEDIIAYFNQKEKDLETVYIESKLPYKPDEDFVKNLLLECLEMHFGSLENVFPVEHNIAKLIDEMGELLDKYRR